MENEKWTPKIMPTANMQNSNQASMPHPSNTHKSLSKEHQMDVQTNSQVKGTHTTSKADAKILSVHLNNTQTSMYDAKIGDTNAIALFDSGATISCISKQFYDKI